MITVGIYRIKKEKGEGCGADDNACNGNAP